MLITIFLAMLEEEAIQKNNVEQLQNLLISAGKQGDYEAARYYLQKGAQVDVLNKNSEHPLAAAVYGMNPDLVYMMLTHPSHRHSFCWDKCIEHNLQKYKKIYVSPQFQVITFGEWDKLLDDLSFSTFLQATHLHALNSSWPSTNEPWKENQLNWVTLKRWIRSLVLTAGEKCSSESLKLCKEATEKLFNHYQLMIKNTVILAFEKHLQNKFSKLTIHHKYLVFKEKNMRTALILLNQEEKTFGFVLNGLCHMAFGMGHKIPAGKIPNIAIRFAPSSVIYQFRQRAHALYTQNKKNTFYSDFLSAMNSVKPLKEHMEYIASIKEHSHTYLGVCFCSDDENIAKLLPDFNQNTFALKEYEVFVAKNDDNQFDFAEDVEPNNNTPEIRKKMSMSLLPEKSITPLLNSMVIAAIEVGRRVPRIDLHFMPCIDGNGNKHYNISLHPFPILKSKNLDTQNKISKSLDESKNFISYDFLSEQKIPLAICGYGEYESLSEVFNKDRCSLWNKPLPKKELVSTATVFPEHVVEKKSSSSKFETIDPKISSSENNSLNQEPKTQIVAEGSFSKTKMTIQKIELDIEKLDEAPKKSFVHQLDQISGEYSQKIQSLQEKIEKLSNKHKKKNKHSQSLFQHDPDSKNKGFKNKDKDSRNEDMKNKGFKNPIDEELTLLGKLLAEYPDTSQEKVLLKQWKEDAKKGQLADKDKENLKFLVLQLMSKKLTAEGVINNPNSNGGSTTSLGKSMR